MYAPVTVVLEDARLTYKGKCREYDSRLNKTYQALRLLLGSPLSKSNKLRVYIHTTDNVLVDFSYLMQMPEDITGFNETMLFLLKRLIIKAENGTTLAKVVKNPVSNYLPPNSIKVGLSSRGIRLPKDDLSSHVQEGYVFFISILPGKEYKDVEFEMKVSDFELSIDNCCTKLASIFEDVLVVF